MLSWASGWLISHLGLWVFYFAVALITGYSITAVVPVWRSASAYPGATLLKHSARFIASIASAVQIAAIAAIIVAVISVEMGDDATHDPDRIAEKTAIPSETHPLAGFWKYNEGDNYGLAIAPAGGHLYSVSFCGPGGCFKPGTYRPDTPIVGDTDHQVISTDVIRVRGSDGWSTVTRSAGRGGA